MEENEKCPYCKGDKKPKNKYCSMTCRNKSNKGKVKRSTASKEKLTMTLLNKNIKLNGQYKDFNVKCYKCEKEIIINEPEFKFPMKDHYYCNRSCANSRDSSYTQTKEFRKNHSEIIKKLWLTDEYRTKCLNSLKKDQFNSKGERLVRKHFQEKYPNDEWTTGAGLHYKNNIFCRDMYSNKLKVCFEYDGIWHFKDIKGQLKQKQFKDKLLEDWCLENNYRLIRFRDEIFLSNPEMYLIEIEKLIYESTEQIIKIYDLNLIQNETHKNYSIRNNTEKAS